jgi:filamentous hemagglutinin family protein
LRLVLRPRRLLSRLMAVLLVTVGALPVHALDPNALPTGGRIAAGAATITQSGNRLNVNQSSDRAILNWSTFNIGANAAVSFVQPNSGSVALNRVLTSAGASDIQGRLTANGQVFLVNPSGVLFGKGAQVDVGGLVASTLDISDTDFLGGRYVFSRAGAAGSIINQGTLNAAQGGYIALLAPEVRNEGVITARLGSVALAAGNQVTLDFAGDRLVSLAVDQAAVNALVENRHLIQADGGNVILAARSAGDLAATVVNNTGLIQATSVSRQNGVIRLEGLGTGVVASSGTIDASGRGAGETGGTVKLLGDKVGLMAGAVIDASGDAGGGSVLVGGNYQGQGPERNASFTFIDPTARIWADAVTTGDGGKVIAWADDTTRYYGSISARGGANGGNGGFVEVSGKDSLVFKGDVDTRAPHGATGMLLLDPANIIIANGSGDSIDDGDASTTSFSGAPSGTTGTVITTDNPGGGTLTLFESELQGIAATTNISLAATNAITINNLADNNLNLAQTAGNSVSFNSATFAMTAGDTITTAGGAVNITTTGAATVAGLSTGGGAILLDVGGTSTVSGVIAGTGTTLTKQGAGTLTLSGANTYTGLTTVSAGTLVANNNAALGTTAGATTVTSGATLAIQGGRTIADALTITGSGVGGTAGALRNISGNNTYTGAIALGAGGARINADLNTLTISGAGSITGAEALTIGGAGNATISKIIATGAGTLTKDGAGTLTLSGNNTYSGATTISAGILSAITSANALGATGVASGTTIAAGATLAYGSSLTFAAESLTMNGGTLSRSANNPTMNGTIALTGANTVTGTAGTFTLGGIVSGTGSLAKTGAGTVVLSGNNTYSGATTISAGTLRATTSANALGATGVASGTTIGAGATLAYGSSLTFAAESLTMNGGTLSRSANNPTMNGTIALTGANTVTGTAGTFTLGGIVSGTGSLAKTGAGTVVLSGNNTYSGATTISAGTLRATTSANALGATGVASGTTIGAGATLAYGSSLTFAAESLTMNGGTLSRSAGNPTMNGTIALTGANTVTGTAVSTFTLGGIISGTGSLAKTGTGTVVLAGANTYTGATSVSAGILQLNSINGLGDVAAGTTVTAGTLAYNGSLTFDAESLTLNGGTLSRVGGNPTMNGAIGLTGANTVTGAAGTFTLGGIVSGAGSLAKTGAGTVVLSGDNAYSGATTVSAGTLSAQHANALGTTAGATTVSSGATLDINGVAIGTEGLTLLGTGVGGNGALTGTGTASLGGTVAIGAASTIGGTGTLTLSGIVSGTALTKTGAGTLVLSGANSYTGLTTVSAGTLTAQNATALGTTAGATTVSSGATLDINGVAIGTEGLTLLGTGVGGNGALTGTGTASLGGTVAIGAASTIGGTGTLTLSGIVSGTALTKTGAGTLVLSGANSYTGLTTVSAGTLTAQNATALGTTAGATTVSSGATLDINGVAIGTEGLTLLGTGVGGNGALTGTGTASLGGTVAIGAASTIGGTGTLTLSGIVSGTALTKTGAGTLVLSGANSYTGLTTVSAGTLTAQNATALGTTAGATTVSSGATLDINGVAIGTEGLTLLGTGVGGNGALTGTGTASLGGTVAIGAASTIGGTGTLTLSGIVSGTALTKTGAGTLVLSGANSYTGLTTVSAGTLIANNNAALGTTLGGTSVAGGATLEITNGTTIGPEALNISGAGVGSNGALVVTAGSASIGGAVTLDASASIGGNGSLTLGGTVEDTVPGTSTLTQVGSGTLTFSGTVGATNALAGMTTSVGQTTVINGGSVTTSGDQSYAGSLATGGATALTATAGAITATGIVTATAGTLTLAAASTGDISFNNAGNNFGTVAITSGKDVILRDGNDLTLGTSGFAGTLTANASGKITLGGSLTAGGAGDAIVLVAGTDFDNSGNHSLNPGTGRWLVYSTDPGNDTRGAGLLAAYDFKQYNTTFGGGILGTGDGFIYSLAPTITAGLTGTASKVYNGNASAALAPANYTVTGVVDGDTVTLNNPATGSYDDKNVGAGKTVTVTGIGFVSTENSGKPVYGYQLASTTANANIGEITPKALTSVSLTGSVSKVYDGTATVANLGTANYSIAGFIGGEGATITNTTGSYDNGANVAANPAGSAVTSTALVAGDYSANVGTTLSNYTLITGPVVGNIGEITPKALTSVSLTGSVSKVYDGTATVANLGTANYSIAGFIGGEGATITNTTGSYDNGANVAANPAGSAVTSTALVAGDYSANVGTTLSNYTLITGPVVGNIGEITPKALTSVSLTGSVSKVYDGTATVANLGTANYSIAGFIGGEGATITNTTGSYDNGANVAANPAGSAVTSTALVAGDYSANVGTTLSNYTLITGPVVGNIGEITPKALTSVSLTGSVSKVYDGTATVANLGTANYSIAGFIGGEGATITNTTGSYDNGANVAANPAGSAVTSTALVAGDYSANVGTTLSNYTLITGPVVGNIGEITPKALTSVSLTGSVSKVYDGTATVANLGTANYSIAGFIGGEGATITNTTGSYDNGANVAANPAGSAVTSTALVAGDYSANVGTTLSNYTLITGPVVGNIGEITPKALTSVSLTGSVSKVYDGTATVANLGTANYSIAGFIGGEGATITNTTGSYDNGANVAANPAGSAVTSTALVAGDYSANVGTTLSNYTLITGPVVGNIGEITPKALTSVSLTGSVSKVYDGTATVANLGTANYSIAGFIGGEGATITNTTGSYDNGANVAANPAGSAVTSTALVAGDYSANVGTTLSNYTLITGPVVGNIGEITPKALTSVSLTGSVSKVYDGTATVANLGTANYSIAGFIGGEGATITNTTGSYDNGANVAANPAGSAVTSTALVAGDYSANVGTTLSNYTLITGPVVGNIGEITPKALTSVSLTGSVSKVYDGTATVANLGTANYSIAGFIGGEGATITNTTGSYDNGANVAANPAGSAVTSTALVAGDYSANVGTTLSNYTLITGPVVGNIGEITPKALTSVSLTGSVSKVYDGTATVANLGTANYSIAGFIGGEGATITNTTGSYDNGANVAANPAGSAVTSTALVAGDYSANVGTTLSNYTLITGPVVGNIGEITPKALTSVSLTGSVSKVYDGTATVANLGTANYSIAGFIGGEGATITNTTGSYDNGANVAANPAGSAVTSTALVAGDYSANVGTTLSNYTLITGPVVGNIGEITPKALTSVSLTGSVSKVYDGTATVANLGTANYSIAGFIGGEGATITNTTGSYDNGANVAANPAGSAVTSTALVAGDYSANVGTTLSNYTLITGPVVGNIGEITPKALTSVSLTGSVSKVYDGTATVANLGTANYSIAGFIGGEGATITNTTGSYDNGANVAANPAGSAVTSTALVAGDYSANVGTTLSNYTLITGPVVGNIGEITPKALTSVSLTGSVSKVYDGTATVANLGTANYSIAGFIGGEGATITNTTGSYDNGANVAANPAGSAVTSTALVAGDYSANVGTTLSNYTLITGPVVGNIGEITPKALTSVSLTGSVSKVYDGTATVANLGTANYTIAGFIGGEGATITNTTGSYDNGANVAANPAGSAVTSTALVAGDYSANVGTTLSNYTLITGPVVGNIGEITPKALTSVSLTGSVSKVYDGTATVANLGTANYSIAGFIGGEGATITNTTGSYDNGANVAANPAGSAVTSTALVAGDYSANVGTTLSNYTLITGPVVGNIGEITPKALTSVSLTGSVSKVYDGTATVANLGTANYSIAGFIGGEGATITTTTTGSYDNGANVAANPAGSAVTSTALVAGDYSANVGTTLSNYTLITGPVVGNIGEITPKALTSVSLTGSVSKVYDGTATVANLGTANYSIAGFIAGFIGGEGATITNTTGSYDNGANVAANPAGSAVTSTALVAGDYSANVGTTLSNYTLITGPVVGNIGEITPKALTSVSLTGSVSKVYDGTATVANLGTANYSIAGFIGGEGATITNTTGSYDNGANVAANPAGSAVTSTALVAGDYSANVGTTLSNYTLITGPVVGNIGEITPKALTSVSLTGSVSKVYDGTATVANLGTANYSIAGFIGGEGATITNTTGSYDNGANVAANPAGSAVTSTALVAGDYSANVGTTLSNYTLITGPVVGNIGEITPKALTSVSLTGSVSKVYDGTATVANLGTANYSIAGFIGGEGATITNTTGSYDNGANVAANPAGSAVTSTALVAGDYSANVGTTLSNYTLITGPVVGNIGEITPKALTSVSLTGSVSKVYDGTATVANLGTANYSIAGFIGGEGATITNTTGSYDNGANVAANPAGSAVTSTALVAGDYSANVGTTLSNYTLITGPVVGNIGEITPKALTSVSLTGSVSKVYDGTATVANLGTANYSIAGFIGGEGATITNTTGSYDNGANVAANPAGSAVTSTALVAGDYSANVGTTLSNYTLITGPVVGNIGEITPKALTSVSLTGSVSKVYDGTATVANLGTANYSIAGFIGGEGATITNTTGSYDNGANVAANPAGSAVTSTALVAGDYSANVGTTLSNYTLITGPVVGNIGEITPKALTVTADDKSKSAGTPNPPFTASYSGFVAGEGLADLGGSLLFSTPATVASPVGSYLVTPSGLTSSNYAIGFIDGLLFVTDPATVSNPAAAGAIASIFATDDRLIRTSVEPGGGLVDALNPQPPPTEKQVSAFISVVDCGINVPGSVCNSR